MKRIQFIFALMGVAFTVVTAHGQDWAFASRAAGDEHTSGFDLRSLNENIAGEAGFVRLSRSGDTFVLGNGTPVRFWATNTNIDQFDDQQLEQHARWLARMGINMVRLSGATLQSKAPGSKVTDVAESSLQKAWRIVAALKKQGIYTTIHPYWGMGNEAMMLDAERWSYMANDVIAKNYYFSGMHEGLARGYAVRKGDLIADRSVLLSPAMLSVNMKQVVGRPNIISECTWTNRDSNDRSSKGESAMKADPLAFLVGRVEVRLDGDPAKTSIADISQWIDSKNKIIHSSTGELAWNYGVGVCTINTPKAQGACGFLKQAGPIRLADVQLDSADPYASVLLVPLDDLPLKESKKVLIQVGTTARPTGWKTEPAP